MINYGQFKSFKDPVYGYIEIPKETVRDIIDTPCFQRLSRIRQTGYSAVYPSSLHNRFVHSLGVYHLGKQAVSALGQNNQDSHMKSRRISGHIGKYAESFSLACLLHDIGQPPFSHIGEKFLDRATDWEAMVEILGQFNNFDHLRFGRDAKEKEKKNKAAHHEVTGVRIALEHYGPHIAEPEFFARCILGIPYAKPKSEDEHVRNCLIPLLNSTLIDVDRLDYIIRDATTAGYQSTGIDFVRLFRGLAITDDLQLVYTKHALSVLENILLAHDAERKWIQNHPVINYENFLVEYALFMFIKHYNARCLPYEFFAEEKPYARSVRLLSDEDILYTVKNQCHDSLIDELFGRGEWRRPLWKSEAEYRLCFVERLGEEVLDDLEKYFQSLNNVLTKQYKFPAQLSNVYEGLPVINEQLLSDCEAMRANGEDCPDEELAKAIDLLKALKKFNINQFDYVIVQANMFNSNFIKKESIKDIQIYFPMRPDLAPLDKVTPILQATNDRKNFYYLYQKKNGQEVQSQDMVNHLCRELIFKAVSSRD